MPKQTPTKQVLFASTLRHPVSRVFAVVLTLLVVVTASPVSPKGLLRHFLPSQPVATAATTNTLNFQARLQNAAGAIVADGTYNIEFNLYTASSGGSTLWTEDYLNSASQGVTVKNGYVTVNLGSITAFPSTINWDQNLYLGMTVRGTGSCTFGTCTPTDAEMTPRLQLTASAYAFKANQLAQYDSGTTFTSSLKLAATTTGGNQVFQIQDAGAAGTYTLLTSANGIQLQGSTPGSAQTGNFNVTGTGIVGVLQAASGLSVTAGATTLTGATTGDALTVSNNTSTGNIAVFKDNSTAVATIADGGGIKFQNSVDSNAALRVMNAAGTDVLRVNTLTGAVGINVASPLASLHVGLDPGGTYSNGFETGALAPFTSVSSWPWYVESSFVNSGSFAAQAGALPNGQSTALTLTKTISSAGTVSFVPGVSSEAGFDFLRFYIDGVQKGQWSGNLGFSTGVVSYATVPGSHTFSWAYEKDGNTVYYSDTAWVDDISITNVAGSSTSAAFDGNVGIGTAFPSARLHVTGGDTLLSNTSTTALKVQTAAAVPVLTVDTTNSQTILRGINSDAVLGSELVTSQNFTSATYWSPNNTTWTTTATTAAHVTGNTTAMTATATNVPVVAGNTYQVTFTVASNSVDTNTVTPGIGGQTGPDLGSNTTHTVVIKGTTTSGLTFQPSTNFNGTISNISVKLLTPANSVLSVQNSAGTASLEVRTSTQSTNQFIGLQAGRANTTGFQNTASGYHSLQSNTTGNNNSAFGAGSLASNTTGTDNTALGMGGLLNNTIGSYSTAVGSFSLQSNTTGSSNTASGYRSLYSNTTGSNNTASGNNSLQSNTTGSSNAATGNSSLYSSTTGTGNTASGNNSLFSNTTGSYNTASGTNSLFSNTTGSFNTTLGYNAGYQDANGSHFVTTNNLQRATAIGAYAQVQASDSIVLGSVDNATKVGIGTTVPLNTFSVSPLDYQTGTATRTNSSATLTGTGTTWTAAMVGDVIVFADGTTNTVTAFTNATTITMGTTYTGTTDASPVYYRFHKVGLQVTSAGNVYTQGNSTTQLQVLNAAGTAPLTVDTTNSQTILRGINSDAVLGSELVTSQDFTSATYWSPNNTTWTTTTTTAAHVTGNTTAMTATATNVPVVAGNTYQVTFTVASNSTLTETVTPTIGGVSGSALGSNATHTVVITATSTSALTFTPTTNFNGTISAVSVKIISLTNSVLSVQNSTGSTRLEVRTSLTTNNQFIGLQSGQANTTGNFNTANGMYSLQSNTTGSHNTANGYQALYFNTTGSYNTAVGKYSLLFNTAGSNNTASGYYSLGNNTTGSSNTASGYYSLQANTTGNSNTASGYQSLQANTTGGNNTASGYQSLQANTTGGNNTASGYQSLLGNTTGSYNTASGVASLQSNTTGSYNSALGHYAGYQEATASFKTLTNLQRATAIGAYAQVQASDSIVLGSVDNPTKVGIGTTVPLNTFSVSPLDYQTGGATRTNSSATLTGTGTTWTAAMVGDVIVFADGTTNTVAGFTNATTITMGTTYGGTTDASSIYYRFHKVGLQVTSAGKIGLGNTSPAYALDVTGDINTSGYFRQAGNIVVNTATGTVNSFFGVSAGNTTATGSTNTATGNDTLHNLTSGNGNTSNGYNSLWVNSSGSYNTAMGSNSLLSNTTGSFNTAVGRESLRNSTGDQNTATGEESLRFNTTGSYNTANGLSALNSNTTGSYNTGLGYLAGYYDSAGFFYTSNNLQRATAIGAYAQVQASDSIVLGSVDNATKVGIGTTVPLNTFSVSPLDYQTGTATRTNSSATLTGTGTTWTAAMVGDVIVFADGTTNTVTGFTNATTITMGTTYTGTTDASPVYYRFHKVGLQVTSAGKIGLGNTSPAYALDVIGDINATGVYRVGGTSGATTTCSGGNVLQNQVVVGGIVTGGTCAAGGGGGGDAYLANNQTFSGNNTFSGTVLLQPASNSTTNFQIKRDAASSNTPVLTVDTTNSQTILRGISSDAVLGSELVTSQDFTNATYWSPNNTSWTTTTTTATHVTGNYTSLSATSTNVTVVAGNTYKITFTIASNTTTSNTITPKIGGVSGPKLGANTTHTVVITATTTGALSFTPDNQPFDGTISAVSVKLLTFANSVLTVQNSAGTANLEVRTSTLSGNQFIGLQAGQANATGHDNTASGSMSLQSNTAGNYNVAAGTSSLRLNTTGSNNTGIGYQSLYTNTTGTTNTAVGSNTLSGNTTGSGNNAFGYQSLNNNITGSFNNGYGYYSLYNNTSGSYNVASGMYSLYNNWKGDYNTASGYQSSYNTSSTASNNTSSGSQSLYSNITGSGNAAFGDSALYSITGSYNSGLGYYAGYQDANGHFVTSSNLQRATAIGAYAQVQASDSIVLGSVDNATKVGIGTTVPLNTFSVSPLDYQTGTATRTNSSATLTGTGTTWTAAMVGDVIVFADGTTNTVTAFTNATTITMGTTYAGTTDASPVYYRFHKVGLQVTSAGKIGLGNTSPAYALDVTGDINATGVYRVGGTSGATTTCSGGNVLQNQVVVGGIVTGGTCAAGGGGGGDAYLANNQTFSGNNTFSGTVLLQPASNSTTNFQIKRDAASSNTPVLTVDTANSQTILRGINSDAVLGSELVTSQDFTSATYWTPNNTTWTTTATTAAHVTGNTTAMTATATNITVVSGNTYQVTFTVAGNATPTNIVTPKIGGIDGQALGENTTHTVVITATTTGALTFTPSTNFNGTISAVSVKLLTLAKSALTVQNSAGTANLEVRTSTQAGNQFIGLKAGQANTSGYQNTASGYQSLQSNTSGNNNTATGYFSLQANTTGTENTTFGSRSLSYNTTGNFNTASGSSSLQFNTTGSDNTAYGYTSLQSNTTGTNNTAYGSGSLQANTTGNSNVASGSRSLLSNTTGYGNTAAGYESLRANITGYLNTASGNNSLQANTTGDSNTASGYGSLYSNTTGSQNTAFGYHSLRSNTTGLNNTGLGYAAGYQDSNNNFKTLATLQNATAIGAFAQVQANNSIVLGSVDNATKVGIGTTVPLNTFSVSPLDYQTGTATRTNSSATLTGTGTTWTAAMVGDVIVFADGTTNTVSAFTSATSITMGTTYAGTTDTTPVYYRFHKAGFQVDSSGAASVQTTSTTAFQVQNNAGNSLMTVDTSANQVLFGKASTLSGKLVVANSTNANTVSLTVGAISSSYTLTLPTALGSTGQCLSDTTGTGTLGWANCGGGGGGGGATRKITLVPEYPGATMHAGGVAGQSCTGNTGTVTSDWDNTNNHNYYVWSATAGTLQCYEVVTRTQIPSDYASAFGSFTVQVQAQSTSTANNDIYVQIKDNTAGTTCTSGTSLLSGLTAGVWAAKSVTVSGCTVSAGDMITIELGLSSKSSNTILIGEMSYQYTN